MFQSLFVLKTMKKPRRRVNESDLDYTRVAEENSKILLKEKYEMLRWTDTVEIKTPNLLIPAQIANYVESLPFCKISVPSSADRFAIMHHSRLLDVYAIDGQNIVQESSVQVLEDEFPQYCLLEFSASGSLLLSTRSSAQIDVFDHQGGYCYDIPLESPENNIDLVCAISSIRTIANTTTDDKYLDILYALQYNGALSVYKIGRLTRFQKLWSTSLELGLAGTFCVLPKYNLLLAGSHYRANSEGSLSGGLCSFRLTDVEPYVEPIRFPSDQAGWLSRLPFSSASYAYLVSMSLNESMSKLVAVSSNGDFHLFDIPHTGSVFSVKYVSGPRPVQAVFIEDEEVGVLFHSGEFVRSSLDELEEAVYSVRCSDKFTSRTTLVAPAHRELFVLATDGGTEALREVALQRTSLACRLWISTLWSSFKNLVGIAVGDAALPLEKATHSESLNFELLHAPTRTLQQLFERTLNERDYSRAKSLAESYDTIDIDIVLKREWRDICQNQTVAVESVNSILRQVSDRDWVIETCITSDAQSLPVQKALVDLGTSFPSASLPSQVRLHHNARILTVCENVDEYLELRNVSCLEAAFRFAERLEFVLLDRLIEQNYSLLVPFTLDILTHIPPSVPPSRFEHLLPTRDGRPTQLDKVLNAHLDALFLLAEESEEIERAVQICNTGQCKIETPTDDYIEWVRQRTEIMDAEAGLPEHCIALLNVSVQRGYEELKSRLESFVNYSFLISTCSLVGETSQRFCEASPAHYISFLRKLPTNELVKNNSQILKLLEWRTTQQSATAEQDLKDAVASYLLATTETSMDVLKAVQRERSELLDKDVVIQCLCHSQLTGEGLLRAVLSAGVSKELASALSTFHSRGVKPTFKQLWESTTNPDAARRLLIRMARCGQATCIAEWEALRDEVHNLTSSIYDGVIDPEEAAAIVTREMLSDTNISHDKGVLQLFLTLDKKASKESHSGRLSLEKSAEVLIKKSEELMQEASSPDDPVLWQSRSLAEAARGIAPKEAGQQLKLLETVDLARELGSTALPVAIKFAEPYAFLEEIIKLNGNYKQGKKCAKLAVLLGVDTPVATALSLCALSALVAHDERYLGKYIHEVIAKGRDLPVVHELCIRIMESSFVPEVMEEIYACALLNAPQDKLMETLDLIQSHRSARKHRKFEGVEINDKLVIDPMYARARSLQYVSRIRHDDCHVLRECSNLSITEVATLLSDISSSLALCTALTEAEFKPWTKNDFLIKYEQALRALEPQLNDRLVESVPPSVLISQVTSDTNLTALDRLSDYGCDRERFIEDPEYRKESIVGLAMTEDDAMYADALQLAQDFKMNDWPVHFASLENALTSLSIQEAKAILKSRGHLARLRSDPDRLHSQLRTLVGPLMTSNDKFIAYLSLFTEGQPERAALPVLKRILEKKRDLKAVRLFTDADYLYNLILSIPDRVILSLVDGILSLPVGAEACEAAARILLDGTEIRPAANPAVIFALLRKDEASFIDLVACKTVPDELQYLERAALILEATPNADKRLIEVVRDRLSTLRTSLESSSSASSTPDPFEQDAMVFHRRRR
uniref:Neuroblastoma-amplified sequence n=1 Tax=Haemonchus contortus TaxID=6289 RepID=W6NB32_HAECO